MWGRYTYELDWGEVVGLYQLTLPKEPPDGLGLAYNAAAGQMLPIIRPKDDGRELSLARLGLLPFANADADNTISADAETLRDDTTFRDSFIRRRCIVPATGWYDWKKSGAERQGPYYFRPAAKPLAFAGIWDVWKDDGGSALLSFAIVTTGAAPSVQPYHHRMPLILEATMFQQWMLGMPNEAAALMVPYGGVIEAWEVGADVSNVRNNRPELMKRVGLL